ncbi:hypothetical protein FV219_11580, partial [Methylobacterium sp. WL122]
MLPLALTLGDPAGIGPELVLAAWLASTPADPLPAFFLVADPAFVERTANRLGLAVPIAEIDPETATEVFPRALPVVALPSGNETFAEPGVPDSVTAGATIESITAAVGFVRTGRAAAVVTNPIAKFVLTWAGFAHPGHTEFLAALAVAPGRSPPRPVMMIWSETLAVVPVTIHVPLRDVKLPTHRDFPVALRAALRVAIGFGLTAAFMILSGLPQTSFALVQVASTCALSSTAPDPKKFAVGVLIGMPLASLFAGIVLFAFLNGNQGFPLLAIAMIVPVFVACFLSLNQSTFGIGFIALVFTPVLIAPENPQSYDPQTYLMNVALVIAAAIILFLAVRLVLPISPSQHRAFALDSAKRALAEALAGEGGDATTRTSLNADRLFQFAGYTSGSRAVRRMAMVHAFALSQLESAAARAHAQMRLLDGTAGMRDPVAKGR